MPDAPWTITSSKRKSNTGASSSRKRTKRGHDALATNQHVSVLRPQQTLTQIAFVTSSSFEDDNPLLDLEPLPMDTSRPATEKPARILKRDSTFTQMDFGNSFSGSVDKRNSSMRPPIRRSRKKPKKRDSTLTQMDFFHGSMDGAAEFDNTMLPDTEYSPAEHQVTVLDFSSTDRAPATPIRNNTLVNIHTPETQDYQPGKRKRKQDATQQDTGKRRRSSRIAAATSPAIDITFLRPDPTMAPSTTRRRTPAALPRKPLLEIQDSTEFLEEPMAEVTLPQLANMATPFTPTKSSDRIPSSQTPESIQRSATRRPLSPSKSSSRQPLAELSTNTRLSTRKGPHSKARTTNRSRKRTAVKSPPRKVCVLKVSKSALASMERGVRVEELEHDIYSLQPTSTPARGGHSSQNHHSDTLLSVTRDSGSGGGPTIKETVSSQRMMESQESLPDIYDLLNLPPAPVIRETAERPAPDPALPATPLRSLAMENPVEHARSGSQRVMISNQEPLNMIPELEQIPTDELSDLGSPVANDTQFIRNLHERLSSPVGLPNPSPTSKRAVTVPRARVHSPNFTRGLPRASISGPSPRKSPLPAPMLVSTSPAQAISRQTTGGSSLRALASLSTQNRSIENVKIRFVPLNDTAEHLRSSSSPRLPVALLSSTQKSTQLASIPRPSQTSTQAPSQGFPSSSAPQPLVLTHDPEIERITIKDSSSFPARLSQVALHVDDQSDLEGSLDLFEESQCVDDLDLDPSTLPLSPTRMWSGAIRADRPDEEDVTQTPTQRSRRFKKLARVHSSTQSSPMVINATTRSQRDAQLEVVALTSSSSPSRMGKLKDDNITPKPQKRTSYKATFSGEKDPQLPTNNISPSPRHSPPSSSLSSSPYSPSPPRVDLKKKYSPIPGFNNDTQSDYTQNGSVTAAYVHRMWDRGDLPRSFVPKPYKLKNFKSSMRAGSSSKQKS